MTATTTSSSTLDRPLAPHAPSAARQDARLWLAGALVAGAVTQALFYDARWGLNAWLWESAAAAALLAVFRRGRVPVAAWTALAACVGLGFAYLAHASEWTGALAVPEGLTLLLLMPALARGEAPDVSGAASRALRAVLRLPLGAVDAGKVTGAALGGTTRRLAGPVGLGLLLGVPVAIVFVMLLSFDPAFVAALDAAYDRFGTAALVGAYVLLGAGIALAFARAQLVVARTRAAAEQPSVGPYRHARATPEAPAAPAPWVSQVTWAMVLAQVAAVFAVYVGVSVPRFFRTHELLRAAGETYSGYLHAGFFQLLCAATLSVCLVLAGHFLVRPSTGERTGPVPGGAKLKAVECTLLGLTGVTLASCVERLALYEQAYGATYLRLGVAFVDLAVGVVLVLTVVKSLRRGWTGYASALLVGVAAVGVAAASFDADGYVARRNLDRAQRGAVLDLPYLESLGSGACTALDHPYLRAHPADRAAARDAWRATESSGRGWRSMRGLDQCE